MAKKRKLAVLFDAESGKLQPVRPVIAMAPAHLPSALGDIRATAASLFTAAQPRRWLYNLASSSNTGWLWNNFVDIKVRSSTNALRRRSNSTLRTGCPAPNNPMRACRAYGRVGGDFLHTSRGSRTLDGGEDAVVHSRADESHHRVRSRTMSSRASRMSLRRASRRSPPHRLYSNRRGA